MPLTLENVVSDPIQEGDAGVIIRRDGSFRIFTTGHISTDALTEEQRGQANLLQILCLVLSNDGLREQLGELVEKMNAAGVDLLDLGKAN